MSAPKDVRSALFRLLPPAHEVLDDLGGDPFLAAMPRTLVRESLAAATDELREMVKDGRIAQPDELERPLVLQRLRARVRELCAPKLRRVLNATGVVIHTNLGRSLLAPQAVAAVAAAAANYSNLEFDLTTGERGSRYSLVEDLLVRLTGAEAAMVVNNNASAVMLILSALACGREVVVSRGQLVEIGGSFRIPEVMSASGAVLKEVGATNRTHVRDYEAAITEQTAALMKVHTSNFRIIGFTKEVSLPELAELGRAHGLPVIEDLGSGNFYDFSQLGLGHEPTVQQTVADGADVVSFSGDKVLGGPQAGIIVGKKALLDRIKRHPVARAVRIDKLTLAALEATLRLYLDPETARTQVPTLAMITATADELAAKARRLKRLLQSKVGQAYELSLRPGASRVGGGAFPERDLPTTLVACRARGQDLSVNLLRDRLRAAKPPLIGRVEDDAFLLDPRTLEPAEFALVASALAQAATS